LQRHCLALRWGIAETIDALNRGVVDMATGAEVGYAEDVNLLLNP
jgi:hypothetical protein